jgi:O-antigen ligase
MTNAGRYAEPGPTVTSPSLKILEVLTILHVSVLAIGATWAFGGNTDLAGTLLSIWGTLGIAITFAAMRNRAARQRSPSRALASLWPLAALNILVVLSAFNPSFRAVTDGDDILYVEATGYPWLPSSARPLLTLQSLWFFTVVYLSCFNLTLVIRQRRTIRLALFAVLGNAAVLAIFGTLQKLVGAKGLYFGLVKSPQVYFFASFIYHNHWGAFTLLMMAAALGLFFHFSRKAQADHFRNSPAFGLLAFLVVIGATLPLSSSRSCTVLAACLCLFGFAHWLGRLVRAPTEGKSHAVLPIAGALLGLGLATAFIYQLGGPIIKSRIADTIDQTTRMKAEGNFGSRAILYRDTWNMAQEKPWFGWGMGAYPTVFFNRNTQHFSHADGLPLLFEDAHSDWIQSFSELGFVGTLLLGLCGLVPLLRRFRSCTNPISSYLLIGCALLLLYAWLEFPFGNRAVVITFWLCFFCAVHYGKATASMGRART